MYSSTVFQGMAIWCKGEENVFRGVTGIYSWVHFGLSLAFCQSIHRYRDDRGRTGEHNGDFIEPKAG